MDNPLNSEKGKIFVVSAPSGAGKTTLVKEVRRLFPNLSYSVSHTTRPPRKGEQNGTDYHFISKSEFELGIQGGTWLEWAKVHDYYYGTSLDFAMKVIDHGGHLLLEIDVQGAKQVKASYNDAVTVFIMPPSIEALEQRLRHRGTDSEAVIQKRLKNAELEIAQKNFYQYVVVNDNLEQAQQEILTLFKQELS